MHAIIAAYWHVACTGDGMSSLPPRLGDLSKNVTSIQGHRFGFRQQRIDVDRMLAQSGDGAFVIDAEGHITLWNHAAEKILGYTSAEVLGRRCCEIFDGRDDHENRICYPACRARTLVQYGDVVHPYDVQTTAKGGASVWLNVSVLSMPPATVHLFRDVTAQRRLLAILQDRLDGRGDASPPAAPVPVAAASTGLSARELEVLKLLAAGGDTALIARRLYVSQATVRNHVQSILRKLGVHSRLEAITFAMRQGWCRSE